MGFYFTWVEFPLFIEEGEAGFHLLALTPVVDLILIIAATFDLYSGTPATKAHALAAIYIGISVGFGKSMIRWADEHFQYYITKTGPKPVKLYGLQFAKQNLKSWGRHLLSYLIGASLIGIIYYFINDYERTKALIQVLGIWSLVLIIDLLISLSYFVFPRQPGKPTI